MASFSYRYGYCNCSRAICSIECNTYAKYGPKPKTNADRIRSMSDGELAQFLMDSFACSLNCPAYDICDAEGACVEFLAKWLQQEAKE